MGSSSLSVAPREQTGSQDPAAAIAEIDDPHSGVRWQLARDPIHPAGPGRLTKILGKDDGNAKRVKQRRQAPVIRAGDRILIDEDSSVADIHLEAIALRPGSIGADILVRLIPDGNWFHAVVVGPGRATLALVQRPSPEVQP